MLNRISRHAPEWLRDLQEYIEIWKMYELIDDADEQISHNIDQFFVDGADEEGIYRWEEAFDLPHTGTMDERKKALLLLLQAKIPYTFRWLKNYLKIVWDDPRPHVVVHFNGDYIITFQPKKEINEAQFYETMRKKIPANLDIEILPAPFVIDESWLGEGVLDSVGLHFLSSGIYEPDMVNKAFIGQGVLESEGREILMKKDSHEIPPLMEFSDGSYYALAHTGYSAVIGTSGRRYDDSKIYHINIPGHTGNPPCIKELGDIYNEEWYIANPEYEKKYLTCRHEMIHLQPNKGHTVDDLYKTIGKTFLVCPKCKTIFKIKEEE